MIRDLLPDDPDVLCQEDRDRGLSFTVVECSGLIHVGLECMCVNISFLHKILTCQDRYPAAGGRAWSPEGELSGTFPASPQCSATGIEFISR